MFIALIAAPGALADDSALSSRLQILAGRDLRNAPHTEQAGAVSLLASGAGSLERAIGGLVVEIRVDGNDHERSIALASAGAKILHVSHLYDTITAVVDESELRDVAEVAGVEYVEEVITPMSGSAGDDPDFGAINPCATGVQSEGVAQLKADAARNQFDVDGSGVKVGILSDSYDTNAGASTHASGDVATNDLPGAGNSCGRTGPVDVIADDPAQSDEGRAMLQIVHDVAPGASLAFATARGGETVFADNIRALAAAGAKVIADDVIYFREPIFQDGVIAKAINDVTAQGVSYFSMAFNSNRIISGRNVNSWMAPAYRPTPCPAAIPAGGSCMNFATSGGPDPTFQVTLAGRAASPPGNSTGTLRLNLDWAEPQFGVTSNFDFYMLNSTGTTVLLSSTDVNTTSGRPNEFISALNATTTPVNLQLVIKRVSGGTPPIAWINPDNAQSSFSALPEYTSANSTDTFGPTIYGHNGAEAAETVAAVRYNNASKVEDFSARGPVTHYFQPVNGTTPSPAFAPPQVLAKPDISATDGGLTTFFGPSNRFFGTSAAAPHAAGVAALQLAANPALSPDDVKNAQETTAVAVGPLPQDPNAGAGLIDAQAAIASKPPAPGSIAITNRPGPITNDSTPTFEFTVTGHPNAISCDIDGVAQACASPFTPATPLADANHTLTISANDFFGQAASPAAASFSTDTTGPAKPKFKKGPKKKTKSNKAKFKFSSTEPGATFVCALDDKLFKPCTSPTKLKVKKAKPKPKKHTFAVEATDALGNAGKVATYKWTVVKKKLRK